MSDDLKSYLRQKLEHLARLAEHLQRSVAQLDDHAIEDPLVRLDRYEALTARFARLQDLLLGPFRSVARLEFEDEAAERVPDLINLMEKRGVVENARQWGEMRALRNAIAHEYWGDEAERDELFQQVLGFSRELLKTFGRLRDYVDERELT
jgi:hypothetical protein